MKNTESFGRFDFVGKAGIFGGLSILFVIISGVYLAVHGVTWGIDFRGGTEMQVKFEQPLELNQVRDFVAAQGIKEAGIQSFGDDLEYVIRFQVPEQKDEKETNALINATVVKMKDGIASQFAAQKPEVRRVDTVGPQVGADLKRSGYLAVFYSLLVILIYVGLRFDYKYSPGAVICLFHDAIIALAIFVAVGKEVNIPVLAAILTLIGYSLNDTIVVFDRIRETEHSSEGKSMGFIINKAINDMLERTVITSGTTFVSALCLWIFADGTVSDIAFALTVGILFGTYSSIYVAAPFILLIENLKAKKA